MKLLKNKGMAFVFFSVLCVVFLLSATTITAKNKPQIKPSGILAQRSTLNLNINGVEYDSYSMTGYVIEYISYYKLTDLAKLLKGTYSQFDIVWNSAQMRTELKKHFPYSAQTSKVWKYPTEHIYVQWAFAPIEVENKIRELRGFLYKGEFYVALHEIMEMMNVRIKWVPETLTLKLIPEIPENVYPLNREEWSINSNIVYDDRWAKPKPDYIFYEEGYYFLVYPKYNEKSKSSRHSGAEVVIEKLSPNMEIIDTFHIPFHGEKFGGFYQGKEYNYFLFGNNNPKENDNAVVLTLLKTDRQFNVIATLDIKNAYTVAPFDAGAVSMSEWENTLIIHTARERYKTPDGLNHQSQLTVAVDTNKMKCLDSNKLDEFQVNHVSHSLNQFALHDQQNGDLFLVDHGDGYPRSVVLTKMDFTAESIKKIIDVVEIPGEDGANQTGIFVGGVEQSKENILVAVNHIDYKKAESFDNFSIVGKDTKYRDVYLYIVSKSSSNDVKAQIQLTDYSAEQGVSYSVPKIVNIGANQFFIMWRKKSDHSASGAGWGKRGEVQYTIVDGNGQVVKATTSLPWHEIGNGDIIYQDDYVLWQVRNNNSPEQLENAAIFRVKVR